MAKAGGKSTTPRTAKAASTVMRDNRADGKSRTTAAAALTQVTPRKGAALTSLVDQLERRSVEAVHRADQLLRKLG